MAYSKATSSTNSWANLQNAFAQAETAPEGSIFTAKVPTDLSTAHKELLTKQLISHVQLILDAADARPPASRPDLGSGFSVRFAQPYTSSPASIGIRALHEVITTALRQAYESGSLKVFTPTGLDLSLTFAPSGVQRSPFQAAPQSYNALLHGVPETLNVQLLKPALRERFNLDVTSVKRVLKPFSCGSNMPTPLVVLEVNGPPPASLDDASCLREIRLDNGVRISVTYPSVAHLDTRNGKNQPRRRPVSQAPQLHKASTTSSKGKARMRDDVSPGDEAPIPDPAPSGKTSACVRTHSSLSEYATPMDPDSATSPAASSASTALVDPAPRSDHAPGSPDVITANLPGSPPTSRTPSPTSVKRPPSASATGNMSDTDGTASAPPAHRARCTSSPTDTSDGMEEDTDSPGPCSKPVSATSTDLPIPGSPANPSPSLSALTLHVRGFSL